MESEKKCCEKCREPERPCLFSHCPCHQEKKELCGVMILTPHYDNGHNGGMWCANPKPCITHRQKENHEKEEWGGWKIVSDMLDSPMVDGMYRTSECYQKLYEFVVIQKKGLLIKILAECETAPGARECRHIIKKYILGDHE